MSLFAKLFIVVSLYHFKCAGLSLMDPLKKIWSNLKAAVNREAEKLVLGRFSVIYWRNLLNKDAHLPNVSLKVDR